MVNTRYVATGNTIYNAEDSHGHAGARFEDGFGLQIPAGALLILQSHYLNYDPEARDVSDMLDVEFSDDPDLQTLGNFSMGTANFGRRSPPK